MENNIINNGECKFVDENTLLDYVENADVIVELEPNFMVDDTNCYIEDTIAHLFKFINAHINEGNINSNDTVAILGDFEKCYRCLKTTRERSINRFKKAFYEEESIEIIQRLGESFDIISYIDELITKMSKALKCDLNILITSNNQDYDTNQTKHFKQLQMLSKTKMNIITR